MIVKLHGARGSYPAATPANQKYGGETPCIEICTGNDRIILDGGTGILGIDHEACSAAGRIDIFLTHLHMDHIQGLAFCKPLFNSEQEVHIWGPADVRESLKKRLNRFLSPPLFPIPLRDLPSQLIIHELDETPVDLGPFRILSRYISHPGPTLGFRVETSSGSVAYLPDHEPMIGTSNFYDDAWISGFDLAANADLLIHDAQYTVLEYEDKFGWGHSSLEMAVNFCARTKARELVLFHHDPSHSDSILDEMFNKLKRNIDVEFSVRMAIQGEEIHL